MNENLHLLVLFAQGPHVETALVDEYMARYVYNLQTGKVFLSTTQK